jgi:hypothetical protein
MGLTLLQADRRAAFAALRRLGFHGGWGSTSWNAANRLLLSFPDHSLCAPPVAFPQRSALPMLHC